MICLASYPRSGNTFLRNVLFEVYGLASATYHHEAHGADPNWEGCRVVKTHLLPNELPANLKDRVSVYLIRDGRDAVVSMAHHNKDVIDPTSSFEDNITEVMYAAEGSHFGGWSEHVAQWSNRADIIIRFEDLIKNPIAQCERLRAFIDLPEPEREKLPSFTSQKTGSPEYGSGKYLNQNNLASKWFRRGQVNAWKDEMSSAHQDLFWHLHGEVMEVAGYQYDGEMAWKFNHISSNFQQKLGEAIQPIHRIIIIEASKLIDKNTDGIKRYVVELLKTSARWPVSGLHIQVALFSQVYELEALTRAIAVTQNSSGNRLFIVLKTFAKNLLPMDAFHWLARNFPRELFRKQTSLQSAEKTSGRIDVVHLTLPQNFEFVQNIEADEYVVTIHDMTHRSHPQFHEANNIRLCEEGLNWLKEKKVTYLPVSHYTAADVNQEKSKFCVTYLGVDRSRFFKLNNAHLLHLIRERYGLPAGDFFLSVSTLEPRKNLTGLIEAFSQLPEKVKKNHPLVLAGKAGWKWDQNQIPKFKLQHVHFIGYVREDHLAALYTMAFAFINVSHYEGFGLPVLEAMACQCPVIVSKDTVLTEIAGDAAIAVDQSKLESIQHGMLAMIERKDERVELGMLAMKRSWKFTWSHCWDKTVDSYLRGFD